jgi:hypothetical protein
MRSENPADGKFYFYGLIFLQLFLDRKNLLLSLAKSLEKFMIKGVNNRRKLA